jgi:hypothetical protein
MQINYDDWCIIPLKKGNHSKPLHTNLHRDVWLMSSNHGGMRTQEISTRNYHADDYLASHDKISRKW